MISIEAREGYIPVTGGRVWYQIVGSGDATPLLVLHGGPGIPHDYLEPLADLADEKGRAAEPKQFIHNLHPQGDQR